MAKRGIRRAGDPRRPARVTIKEVAEAAGISMMTVSNVINNRPNVSAALRERVQKQIDDLGYVPNRAAQELAGVTRPHFGLLYPGVINPFIASVIVGSLNAASRLKVDVSIQLARPGDAKELKDTVRRMQDTGVEGLLLPSPMAEFAAQTFRKKPPVPVVALAPGLPIPGITSVRCNERQAAFELVSMLLDLGHTRIAHLAGPETQSGSIARLEGYKAALISRGIDPHPDCVVRSSEFRFQSGVKAAEALLDLEPRPTAIFAANDTLAASVLAVTHHRDIAVPEELSVVGYDDSPTAEQVWPALTTVRQDFATMTERAVEALDEKVRALRAGTPLGPADDVVLPYEIVRRSSTAQLSKRGAPEPSGLRPFPGCL